MAKASSKAKETPLLLYANPETDADIRYLTGFDAPDPFLALKIRGEVIAVTSPLEEGRARKAPGIDTVLPLKAVQAEAAKKFGAAVPYPVNAIRLLAGKHRVRRFRVPSAFPAGIALALKDLGYGLEVGDDPFFPERVRKNDREAGAIQAGNAASAAGFRAAENLLSVAEVKKNGKLYLDGKPLTAERVRFAIDVACLEAGAVARNTIVAGGDQACDPHERGYGPLRAHELIIIDIFPRVTATGYHGDMTRTYLKGKPSEAQRRLVRTVFDAQQAALRQARAGVKGKSIHRAIQDRFDDAGYPTEQRDGGWVGFFHGTGHGLGLEVHEPPRVSPQGDTLMSGMVVTIEPGLYYPGLGGCRIEDVVRIRPKGIQMLSKHPYRWVL
ncbi:MAG: M24 family metallopeptidase [Opitutales bacterium]